MVGSCEPPAASTGGRHRPPRAAKNTTGVTFERPGASWKHPGATKHTTGVVFGPSRAVLDSSGSFQERPTASKSVLEASRSLPECPGATRTTPGMSSRRFLDASRATKMFSFVDPAPPGSFQKTNFVDPAPLNRFQLLPGSLESLWEGSRASPNSFHDLPGACGKPPGAAPATHQ